MKSAIVLVALLSLAEGQWFFQNYSHIIQSSQPGIPNNNFQYPPNYNNQHYNQTVTGYSINVGFVRPNDLLLFNQFYTASKPWYGNRQTKVNYSTPVVSTPYGLRSANITAIKVEDYNSPPGFAQIQAGGLGFPYVRIKLSSQRGQGYNFRVYIYGK